MQDYTLFTLLNDLWKKTAQNSSVQVWNLPILKILVEVYHDMGLKRNVIVFYHNRSAT